MCDISGDFRDGETVWWAGKETTVRGAEHLFYGRQGQVVGEGKRLPAGKTVKVQFDEGEAVEDYVPLSATSLPSSPTGAAPSVVSSLRVTGTEAAASTVAAARHFVHFSGVVRDAWASGQSLKKVVTRSAEVIHCFCEELSPLVRRYLHAKPKALRAGVNHAQQGPGPSHLGPHLTYHNKTRRRAALGEISRHYCPRGAEPTGAQWTARLRYA